MVVTFDMHKLTDRQEVLIERLVGLSGLAASVALPLDVLEIRGFGSFFRGKGRPKDVDLIFRCHRRPHRPDFARFLELLKKIRFDQTYQDRYDNPRDAMDAAYRASDQPRLPGFDDSEVEQARFRDWLHGHTWNMLHARTMFDDSRITSSEEYAKRMVKRLFPNLNVMDFLNATDSHDCIRHGFTVQVWSRECPDTRANLADLLSEDRLNENTLHELRYFEKQLPVVQAEAELLRTEIGLLLLIARPESPGKGTYDWLEGWEKDREELKDLNDRLRHATAEAQRFDDADRGSPIPPEYYSLGHRKALAMTENMRKEIKRLYQSIELLKVVQWSLAKYQSGSYPSEHSAQVFAAIDALSQGNARERKLMENTLKELEIPIPARDPDGFFPPL